MAGGALSERSISNLAGVHPDLIRVVRRAIRLTPVDFGVSEGLRTAERQAELVKAGASRTMNSRHLTGHAVDIFAVVGGAARWDWPLYEEIARAMKEAARLEGVPIIWGGDWTTFRDGPHFELPKDRYSAAATPSGPDPEPRSVDYVRAITPPESEPRRGFLRALISFFLKGRR